MTASSKRNIKAWLRNLCWGLALYLTVLAILFFVFAQTKTAFIYAAF